MTAALFTRALLLDEIRLTPKEAADLLLAISWQIKDMPHYGGATPPVAHLTLAREYLTPPKAEEREAA